MIVLAEMEYGQQPIDRTVWSLVMMFVHIMVMRAVVVCVGTMLLAVVMAMMGIVRVVFVRVII